MEVAGAYLEPWTWLVRRAGSKARPETVEHPTYLGARRKGATLLKCDFDQVECRVVRDGEQIARGRSAA